jgi:uncharacterized metal-binding protein YceD (DUF177 family)
MGNPLRDLRTPSDLAVSGQVIEFTEKVSEFEHLERIVEADLLALDPAKLPLNWRDSVVAGKLTFRISDTHEGQPVLEGHVAGKLDAVCQRCLWPFRLPLEAQLRLVFSDGNQSDDDCDGYEVWELAEETLRPLDLVEEAIIMAIPFSPMHTESTVCSKLDEKIDEKVKTLTPFADLKAQMASKN